MTGFGTIGHIIQVNLKEGHLKYKNLIGEILLDNIPTAKTVVAKNDTLGTESKIENKSRPYTILAGRAYRITFAISPQLWSMGHWHAQMHRNPGGD